MISTRPASTPHPALSATADRRRRRAASNTPATASRCAAPIIWCRCRTIPRARPMSDLHMVDVSLVLRQMGRGGHAAQHRHSRCLPEQSVRRALPARRRWRKPLRRSARRRARCCPTRPSPATVALDGDDGRLAPTPARAGRHRMPRKPGLDVLQAFNQVGLENKHVPPASAQQRGSRPRRIDCSQLLFCRHRAGRRSQQTSSQQRQSAPSIQAGDAIPHAAAKPALHRRCRQRAHPIGLHHPGLRPSACCLTAPALQALKHDDELRIARNA